MPRHKKIKQDKNPPLVVSAIEDASMINHRAMNNLHLVTFLESRLDIQPDQATFIFPGSDVVNHTIRDRCWGFSVAD